MNVRTTAVRRSNGFRRDSSKGIDATLAMFQGRIESNKKSGRSSIPSRFRDVIRNEDKPAFTVTMTAIEATKRVRNSISSSRRAERQLSNQLKEMITELNHTEAKSEDLPIPPPPPTTTTNSATSEEDEESRLQRRRPRLRRIVSSQLQAMVQKLQPPPSKQDLLEDVDFVGHGTNQEEEEDIEEDIMSSSASATSSPASIVKKHVRFMNPKQQQLLDLQRRLDLLQRETRRDIATMMEDLQEQKMEFRMELEQRLLQEYSERQVQDMERRRSFVNPIVDFLRSSNKELRDLKSTLQDDIEELRLENERLDQNTKQLMDDFQELTQFVVRTKKENKILEKVQDQYVNEVLPLYRQALQYEDMVGQCETKQKSLYRRCLREVGSRLEFSYDDEQANELQHFFTEELWLCKAEMAFGGVAQEEFSSTIMWDNNKHNNDDDEKDDESVLSDTSVLTDYLDEDESSDSDSDA